MFPEFDEAISSFKVMDLLRQANEMEADGRHVVHLEAGQPASAAPAPVIEAARTALTEQRLGYVDARGLLPLRERISRWYEERYGLQLDPRRVVVTTGSSGGFLLSFLSAFPRGGRIGMSAPYYPAYPNILRALGFTPVFLEADEHDKLQISLELIKSSRDSLDGLIIASPANPTGAMIGGDELAAIVRYCADEGIPLISDEIYHGITYEQAAHSAIEFGDAPIVINSFSKYFSMTGWRLGWMVVPEALIRPAEILSQNMFISSPVLSQAVAALAFDCTEELDAHVQRYARNRDYLVRELPQLGFRLRAPAEGGFYLYTDLPGGHSDPLAYCLRMLKDIAVATTPGNDFDSPERGQAVRFSYAGALEDMEQAVYRLRDWV